jgi:hypothetical protein
MLIAAKLTIFQEYFLEEHFCLYQFFLRHVVWEKQGRSDEQTGRRTGKKLNLTILYLSIYGSTALCLALAAFQILNSIHRR